MMRLWYVQHHLRIIGGPFVLYVNVGGGLSMMRLSHVDSRLHWRAVHGFGVVSEQACQ